MPPASCMASRPGCCTPVTPPTKNWADRCVSSLAARAFLTVSWCSGARTGKTSGCTCWGAVWCRATPRAARSGSLTTSPQSASRALSWSASHDSLTGLVNRRELEHRLLLQLQHPVQAGPAAMPRDEAGEAGGCVLFVDLDHFKAVNDLAGHAAGDQVLRQVARVMEGLVRQTDTVGRLGGDEFALLLPGCTLERASQIAEALRSHIEALPILLPMDLGTQAHAIGCSIGLIELGPQYADVAAVLHAADMACYQAKRGGRNQVVITRAGLPVAGG